MDISPTPIDDLPFSDAVEFFQQRGVKIQCPSCGHEQWEVVPTLPTGNAYVHGILPVANQYESPLLGGPIFSVVVTTCTKCFYMRLHSRDKIKQWVADGKPKYVAPQGGNNG